MNMLNSDVLKGKWQQLKGEARIQWGKLTDDDLDLIDGRREELAGRIQEVYGVSKDEAEKQIERFSGSLEAGSHDFLGTSKTSMDRKSRN